MWPAFAGVEKLRVLCDLYRNEGAVREPRGSGSHSTLARATKAAKAMGLFEGGI